MKSIQLINFTTSGALLISQNNQIKQVNIQGFKINNSIVSRTVLKSYVRKPLDCKFGKNGNKIRLQNIEIYEQLIKLGFISAIQNQLSETKAYNAEQKQRFRKAQEEQSKERIQQQKAKIRDYTKNRVSLSQFYANNKKVLGTIQYLNQQICIYYQQQQNYIYLPVKLRNIDHYFQLLDTPIYSNLFLDSKQIQVKLVGCKYNLIKRQYQIEAILPSQVEKFILSKGMGTIALKNIALINPQIFGQYRKLQQQAKQSHLGIFAKPFEILSLVYTKNNLVAVVEEIVEGYIFKIRSKNNQIIKLQLAKIYCPIQNQAGAFTCRQFARKNLIGRQVNVFLTKDQGLINLGSLVRLADNKDIQTLMIQNGCGFVKEQLKGTMFYAKLETLQKKAKQLRKGIHNEKTIGFQYYEDFTVAHSKKQKLDKKNSVESKQTYLNKIQSGQQGVIQRIIDPVTYIIRVDAHKKLIKVKLDGVSRLYANPRLAEVQQLQKISEQFCYRNFFQRTVTLQLTQYDKANNYFVGILRNTSKGKQKLSLQQNLLGQGLVKIIHSGFFEEKWIEVENQAKKKQIGIWNGKLKNFVKKDIYEQLQKQFSGKFSWIQDGQVAYVQPNSATQNLDLVYQSLNNPKQAIKQVKQEDIVPGYVCATQYQKQLYRCRIISVTNKQVLVKFIDWGNKEPVQSSSLLQIPLQLQYIPALSCQVILDIVRPVKTKDPQYLQKLREHLMQPEYKFQKLYGNVVNIFMQGNHVNATLVFDGYLKANLSKLHGQETKQLYMNAMDKLRKELVGIWEIEANDSEIEDQQQVDIISNFY